MNKILIVSSDKDFARGIKSDALFWDFLIRITGAMDELFATIDEFKPDLLIVDFILDGNNGGALCHQLKSNADTRHLPIIMTSDYSGIARFASKFGCDMILEKPVDFYVLQRNISDLLDTSAMATHA